MPGDLRMMILVLCVICSGFLNVASSDGVFEPEIYNNSTKDHLILDCESSTPGVTYKWLDSEGNILSEKQIYVAPRPKEEVTLICVVSDNLSQERESRNITISYSPERKGLSGCGIAWIVVGVIAGIFLLLYVCVFCILSKLLGGGANAFMATGILCCLCTCFCCRRNWKQGLHNIGNAILPFIEKKLGGDSDAERGEELDEKNEGRGDKKVPKEISGDSSE